MKSKNVLEKAREQYNQGNWEASIDIINGSLRILVGNDFAEAHLIRGWSYYYLGIKRAEKKKEKNLTKAYCSFKIVLEEAEEDEARISALNGLPLVHWILGEKEKAWKISDEAIKQFSTVPSIWNTRSILCRWAKKFDEAVEVGQKVYETAVAIEDFRTAGHGKQNKGDALVRLGKTEEAKKEYQEAIQLYENYQQSSGESAVPHLESVQKKISQL